MLCLFAVFAFSCNEDMERLLTDDYPESGTEYTTGHVLMVVIDGASGVQYTKGSSYPLHDG